MPKQKNAVTATNTMSEKAPKGYRGLHERPSLNTNTKRYRRHVASAGDMFLALPVPSDLELVTSNRRYNAIIKNDGSKTYLVHSTTPERAATIMQEGLKTIGTSGDPNLESTVIALVGPDDPDQVTKNAFSLACQYEGGAGDPDSRTAKVVIEIDKPVPAGVEIGRHSFRGTHLGQPDGTNIVDLGPVAPDAAGNDRLYAIPGDRVVGYCDFGNEAAWVSNPNAINPHQHTTRALGIAAVQNGAYISKQ